MASGYKAPREGLDALLAQITSLQGQINALRQALGLESAVVGQGGVKIKADGQLLMYDAQDRAVLGLVYGGLDMMDPDTRGRMLLRSGRIYLWDQFNEDASGAAAGQIMTDQGAGINYLRIFPPYSSGSGLENSITVQGRREGDPGNVWVYSDGMIAFTAPRVALGGLPAVSSPDYQLGYDDGSGGWSIVLVTSSQRYKTPLQPLTADELAPLLDLDVGTFKMIAEVEAHGDDAKDRFGAIAEHLHELGLGHLLVTYNDDGEPDALKDQLVGWALIPLVRQQRDEIEDLRDTVAGERAERLKLEARVDRLEAALKNAGIDL